MLQLSLFTALLVWTLLPVGLIGLLIIGVVIAMGEHRAKLRLLVLPGVWVALVLVAGLFAEPNGPRTAGWVLYLIPVFLVAYVVAIAWTVATLPRARMAANLCAVANIPAMLWAAVLTAMATTGDWI